MTAGHMTARSRRAPGPARPAASPPGAPASWIVGYVLLGLALYAVLWPWFFAGKHLSHDDVALYEATRNNPASFWLSSGYSTFFEGAGYAFIRPVSNALMAFDTAVFGTAFGFYLLPFFVLAGLGAAAASAIARAAGLPDWACLAIGLAVMLQPAMLPSGLLWVTFQQDGLAAVFGLFTALFCLRRNWALAALTALLAVFSKETGLWVPIAAALWALLYARSWRAALLLIAPLAVWMAVRIWAFGSLTGDVYAVQLGGSGTIRNIIRGLVVWPTGLTSVGAIKAFAVDLQATGAGAVTRHLRTALVLGLNVALDLLILIAALTALKGLLSGLRGSEGDRMADDARGLVVIFAAGALGFLVIAAYALRFGPSLHSFLILLLAILIARPPMLPGLLRPVTVAVAALFGVLMTLASVEGVRNAAAEPEPDILRALETAVTTEPPGPLGRILVVGAPVSGPAPSWMMQHWNRPEDLIYGSRIHGCIQSDDAPPATTVPAPDGRVLLTLTLPDCAVTLVFWADQAGVAREGARRDLGDGVVVDYRFPGASVSTDATAGATADVAFGPTVEVTLNPGDFDRVLVFDWRSGSYVPLNP